eukprot:TRINITY_DN7827_c0_g1_i5.p4 TRINITY_DN7827_c0_g1~~TRINITY_DN7827_c0_g1_i5.p4  ORF type:complete len:156 (-),score=69.02 TRINITY_DN7827_c0_g1_i5:195-662(-)
MLSSRLTLKDILPTLKDKRVLMRVDFNVPLKDGVVKDPTRIKATIPSIKAIFDAGAKCIVLISHLERPNGVRNEKYSLKPLVPTLEELAGRKVTWGNDCVGKEAEELCAKAEAGALILLENLRFHAEEEGSAVVNEQKVKAKKEDVEKFRESLSK